MRNRFIHLLLLLASLHIGQALPAQNVGIGTAAPIYKLHTVGDIYANGGWVRVSGNQGLYWENWGGGFFMSDATWIRTYTDKNIWTGNGLLGAQGGLTVGYGGATPPGNGALIAGFTGIGTAAPNQRLSVQGNMEIIDVFDNVLLSRNTVQGLSHHMVGTYMGWDQRAVFLGGYNVFNPSATYGDVNKVMCGGATGSLPIFATAFNTVSARRFKRDFQPVQHGLAEVMALAPVSYHYTFEGDSAQRHIGLIAEDVQRIVPEVVAVENGQCIGLDYSSLVPVLIKAVQEQQAMIERQAVRMAEMEAELLRLKGK
jgi:Chaperone of endosialidase/Bacterial shufflon protein, N-terminal constant region